MYRLIVVLALLSVNLPAQACSLDEAVAHVYEAALVRSGELAKQQLVLLSKLGEVGSRAKDPRKPLNEQLSQNDLAEFTQTKTRFQSVEVLQILESGYARDSRVISEFFTVAQGDYLGKPVPAEGDKEYLPYAFLVVMAQEGQKKATITQPSHMECDIETALQAVELESLERLNKLPVAQATKELNAIRGRNGGAIESRTNTQVTGPYSRQKWHPPLTQSKRKMQLG